MNILIGIKKHIINNLRAYLWVASAFCVGILISFFSALFMSDTQNSELLLYVNDFFDNIKTSGVDAKTLIKISMTDSIKTCVLAFLFSLMIIGMPFLFVLCGALGYTFGFSMFFMLKNFGFKALLFFCTAFLPHGMILLPSQMFFLAYGFNFIFTPSGYIKGTEKGKNVLGFFVIMLFVLIFCFASSLISAYVEPWLISFISKYYI